MGNLPQDEPVAVVDVTVCASCGQTPQPGRSTPLCASCRNRLALRPLPRWLQVSALALLVPFLLAVANFPSAVTAGVAFERGRRAEARGEFAEAVAQYSRVVERFPTSTLAVARKGIAAFHAGQFQIAAEAFSTIGGQKASAEIAREVNDAISQMPKLPR
jgi:tetratricopeptide (TPR) repeat protein